MKVLVDTSVWSLALRRHTPTTSTTVEAFRQLILEGRVVIIGGVRQEILSGVRHREQFEKLKHQLAPFPDAPLTTEDYILAASISNTCRSNGVQTGNIDSLICAVAINNGYQILSTDKDFSHMSRFIPITLYPI